MMPVGLSLNNMWQLINPLKVPPGQYRYKQVNGTKHWFPPTPDLNQLKNQVRGFRVANRLPRTSLEKVQEDIESYIASKINFSQYWCRYVDGEESLVDGIASMREIFKTIYPKPPDRVLCSILIVSRLRFEKLKLAMQSFLNTAKHENIEFIIRLHKNIAEDWDRRHELQALCPNVRVEVFAGRDLNPGEAKNILHEEIRHLARGLWHNYWSDDEVISGRGWDEQLEYVPTTGFIVNPEVYRLGLTHYKQSLEGFGPTPFVPADCLDRFGVKVLQEPPDLALDNLLRQDNGWKMVLLKGVMIFHDREIDRTLPKEKF